MDTVNNPKSTKPIKAKPHFYSVCLEGLMTIAKEHGYNLVVHGSMSRDFDLVAIPWIDEPKSHIEMLDAFCEFLGVRIPYTDDDGRDYLYSLLGGARSSYVINLNRGGRYNDYTDMEYYLDIFITPLMPRP
jgi:hypothetical protein